MEEASFEPVEVVGRGHLTELAARTLWEVALAPSSLQATVAEQRPSRVAAAP